MEHSFHAGQRIVESILFGAFAGGTLLVLLVRAAAGSGGADVVRRAPVLVKVMATITPALAVGLIGTLSMRPRRSLGMATFHPTAGQVGGGREEVELPLPAGWRAVHDLRQDWRSAHVVDARGQAAFVVTADLETHPVRSTQALAARVAHRPRRSAGSPTCTVASTPRGEAVLCRVLVEVGARWGPTVRFEHFERWRGQVLAIALSAPAARAGELEPFARESLEALRLRAR